VIRGINAKFGEEKREELAGSKYLSMLKKRGRRGESLLKSKRGREKERKKGENLTT